MEQDFFELTGADEYEILLLHAEIWLSLTTYAWQVYDSICGAFYNGLYNVGRRPAGDTKKRLIGMMSNITEGVDGLREKGTLYILQMKNMYCQLAFL